MDYRILESDRLEMQAKSRRSFLMMSAAILISLALFSYPLLQDYKPKRQTQKAARLLGLFLAEMKTKAIVKKTPIDVRFVQPDVLEVYEVSSCGPNAKRTKMMESTLAQWNADIVFVNEKWIRANTDWKEPVLTHFCYDPMFGSSLHADGYANGTIFLIHTGILKRPFPNPDEESAADHIVELGVEGASADFVIR